MDPKELIENNLYGIKGWLKFFCIGLTIIFPARSILNLISSLSVISRINFKTVGDFSSGNMLINIVYLDCAASIYVIFLSAYAGITLWKKRPHGPAAARVYLTSYLCYGFLAAASIQAAAYANTFNFSLFENTELLGKTIFYLVESIAVFSIWSLYLKHSKRVAKTFPDISSTVREGIARYRILFPSRKGNYVTVLISFVFASVIGGYFGNFLVNFINIGGSTFFVKDLAAFLRSIFFVLSTSILLIVAIKLKSNNLLRALIWGTFGIVFGIIFRFYLTKTNSSSSIVVFGPEMIVRSFTYPFFLYISLVVAINRFGLRFWTTISSVAIFSILDGLSYQILYITNNFTFREIESRGMNYPSIILCLPSGIFLGALIYVGIYLKEIKILAFNKQMQLQMEKPKYAVPIT